MGDSIGVACNFYKEPNTLPGFLECASMFFDDMLFISSPPQGVKPDDESIAIVKKWGARLLHANIDEGFGVIRTKLIRESNTEWVFIMDADERFFNVLPVYDVHGTGKYPEDLNPQLSVGIREPAFNQGQRLRDVIEHETKNADALRTVRRHWMNWRMSRPCQDWTKIPDWQIRVVRNKPHIAYDSSTKMHERCMDTRNGADPIYASSNIVHGPFHDHFHVPCKAMEPEQRQEDIGIFEKLHWGCTADMWIKLGYRHTDSMGESYK